MAGDLRRFQMYIDGGFCDASDGATFTSLNPATEKPWAEVPEATAEDVNRAVSAARRAFEQGPWPAMSATERGHCLSRLGDEIEKLADDLGLVECKDTGKLLKETGWQARSLKGTYAFYAGLADKVLGDLPPTRQGGPLTLVEREPLGVVVGIVPWNSQLHLAAYKIAPALAAGNTIVMKASEDASGAMCAFADAVHKAGLPKGVFNLVTGAARPCGETLVGHPDIDRISFTGGVETARKIIPASANSIAKLSLELGGKSPIIVFDDADLERAKNGVLAGIFGASGQSCAAGSRLLLHKSIYDEFLNQLIERTREIRIGNPEDPDTDMGPLATRAQRDRIEKLLQESLDKGAKLLIGGKQPEGKERGWYFEPTIVACDHQDYPIVREELFGPVLSVLSFETEEEAIAIAKDSDYGFAGGVFSNDFGRAYRTAKAIPAGRIWINTYRVTSSMVPFGGFKRSGYGRESGIDAIRDYTETKGIFVDLSDQPSSDPFVMR